MSENDNSPAEIQELMINLSEGVEAKGCSVMIARDASYENIESAMKTIVGLERVSQWWMGDVFLQARDILGEEFHQLEAACEALFNVKLSTITHYEYMAKSFPPNQRYNLAFGFHEVVVKLSKKDRREMLRMADKNNMPLGEFKRTVKNAFPGKSKQNDDEFEFVIAQRSISAGDIDMGALYEILADETNRIVTKNELNSWGMTMPNNQDTVWVIVRKAKEKAATDIQEEPPPEPTDEEVKIRENSGKEIGYLVEQAIEVLAKTKRASTSGLQRRLKIGFTRATEVMNELEDRGIVSAPKLDGTTREILVDLTIKEEEKDASSKGGPF